MLTSPVWRPLWTKNVHFLLHFHMTAIVLRESEKNIILPYYYFLLVKKNSKIGLLKILNYCANLKIYEVSENKLNQIKYVFLISQEIRVEYVYGLIESIKIHLISKNFLI